MLYEVTRKRSMPLSNKSPLM